MLSKNSLKGVWILWENNGMKQQQKKQAKRNHENSKSSLPGVHKPSVSVFRESFNGVVAFTVNG